VPDARVRSYLCPSAPLSKRQFQFIKPEPFPSDLGPTVKPAIQESSLLCMNELTATKMRLGERACGLFRHAELFRTDERRD